MLILMVMGSAISFLVYSNYRACEGLNRFFRAAIVTITAGSGTIIMAILAAVIIGSGCMGVADNQALNARLPAGERIAYCQLVSYPAGKLDVCATASPDIANYWSCIRDDSAAPIYQTCMQTDWSNCDKDVVFAQTALLWCPFAKNADLFSACSPDKDAYDALVSECLKESNQDLLNSARALDCLGQK